MGNMTAPTETEIREAVLRHWNRQRDQHDIGPWREESLSGRLTDSVLFDLFIDVSETLYDRDRSGEHGMRGPLDEITGAVMHPIVAGCERLILDGMIAAFMQFAAECPRYPRVKLRKAAA